MEMVTAESRRLLIAPSLLATLAFQDWLAENPTARDGIVISDALWQAMTNRDDSADRLLSSGRGIDRSQVNRLLALLDGVATFNQTSVTLPDEAQAVAHRLVQSRSVAHAVYADEWAFLQAHSWLASRRRVALNAFRAAGAGVIEYGRRLRDNMVGLVVPAEHVPPILTPEFAARVSAKWLVIGGASAAAIPIPPLFFLGLLAVPVVHAFDD